MFVGFFFGNVYTYTKPLGQMEKAAPSFNLGAIFSLNSPFHYVPHLYRQNFEQPFPLERLLDIFTPRLIHSRQREYFKPHWTASQMSSTMTLGICSGSSPEKTPLRTRMEYQLLPPRLEY